MPDPKTKPCVECTRPIYQNGAGNWRHLDTKRIFCYPGQASYARPVDDPVTLGTASIWNTDEDHWFVGLAGKDLENDLGPFETQGAAVDGLKDWAKKRNLFTSIIKVEIRKRP